MGIQENHKVPMGEMPFKLTFGTKAIIPREVGLISIWFKAYEEQRNRQELHSNLDLIDEVKDKAMKWLTEYKGAMARYYNKGSSKNIQHRRPHPQESFTSDKRPILREIRTSIGRTLRIHSSFQTRVILLENIGWSRTTLPVEHKAPKEILSVGNPKSMRNSIILKSLSQIFLL